MKDRTKRLKLPRQEKFAQLVAQGLPALRAYAEAGYCDAGGRGAGVNGSALLKKPHVAARVAEIRELADGLGVALLTIVRKRTFLAEVVETPVGSIGPDSRLCQEFYEKVELPQEGGDGKTVVRRRVRMPDKLRAIELDSKLANHFAAKGGDEVKAEADAVAAKAAELTRSIAERVRKILPVIGGVEIVRRGKDGGGLERPEAAEGLRHVG